MTARPFDGRSVRLASATEPTSYGMAPVWLRTSCAFRILDPGSGNPLPGQDPERFNGLEYENLARLGTSRLQLNLSSHASLGIDLCLPDLDDRELARLATWLQGNLPCKLSPKHWKRWTPTKSGSFVGRKIPAPA